MFPVDTFQAQYVEEREAAELAKRLAKVQQDQQRAQQQQQPQQHQAKPQHQQHASPSAFLGAHLHNRPPLSRTTSHQPQGSALSQALQRPALSRGNSQTVLGNIYQSFHAKRDSWSGTTTPALGQPPRRAPTQAEIEAALVAEKKRDADICAMPSW